ncbi:MAG: WXG100 family type VII secretion target [Anaerolineae bacterium]|nr:WXG100 family type VII secretion target [Anaerolineae bacterium]MDW8173374.1 WXG100 family type VII secretion target [Anaerolineae bacterium]
MSDRIEVNYEQLEEAKQRWDSVQSIVEAMESRLRSRVDELVGGGWVGEAASRFSGEMNDVVLPKLKRLAAALQTAAETTSRISSTMSEAEDQAAGCFRSN